MHRELFSAQKTIFIVQYPVQQYFIMDNRIEAKEQEPIRKKKKGLPFVVRLTCVLVSLVIIFYIAIIGKSIIVPMVIGFLLSMLLLPVANFFERKLRFPRVLSSLISPILFVLAILSVLYLLGTQIVQFRDDFPEIKEQVIDLVHKAQVFVSEKFNVSEKEQLQYLRNNTEKTIQKGSSVVGGVLVSVSTVITGATFVFLCIFFFLLYRSHLVKFVVWCFPPNDQRQVRDVLNSIQSIMKHYIIGLGIQILFITLSLFTIFSIIGIKYAFFFAALCGILNLIPYLGIFSATVLAASVTLATSGLTEALWVVVSVIGINSIDGNIITPKVIGSKVSLNSFVVLFGIIIAESFWGIAGMFLAIPILAIVKIVFDAVPDLKPYGFLLGEDNAPTPMFEKYYNLYKNKLKPKDEDLSRELQSEDQNHEEFDQSHNREPDESVNNDDEKE